MELFGRLGATWDGDSFVARLTRRPDYPEVLRQRHALVSADPTTPQGFRHVFFSGLTATAVPGSPETTVLDPRLAYLSEGDVIRVKPRAGEVEVIYRRGSHHNCLIPTTRCNLACGMCAQPPTGIDPEGVRDIMESIPLFDPSTETIGISGGEPTLLGRRLVEMVKRLRVYLPETKVEILSNGILLRYLRFAQDLAQAGDPNLTIGVPIHADVPELHDRIAGRPGAFDDTILGLLNLQRVGIPVELRVIIQRPNLARLAALGEFIGRNLCFASHVAFMGLERAGRANQYWDDLWIDPAEYQAPLASAVAHLRMLRLPVSIYNLPLCVLDRKLWPYSCQSISDWKNEFPEQCSACEARSRCCGLFRLKDNPLAAAVSPIGITASVAVASANLPGRTPGGGPPQG